MVDLLPRYKCHKTVRAGLIVNVSAHRLRVSRAPLGRPVPLNQATDVVELPLDEEWQERHAPKPGDVLVVYADGYMSVSPIEPFRMGYDLIEPELPQTVSDAAQDAGPDHVGS